MRRRLEEIGTEAVETVELHEGFSWKVTE